MHSRIYWGIRRATAPLFTCTPKPVTIIGCLWWHQSSRYPRVNVHIHTSGTRLGVTNAFNRRPQAYLGDARCSVLICANRLQRGLGMHRGTNVPIRYSLVHIDIVSRQATLEMWWMCANNHEVHVRFQDRDSFWRFLKTLSLARGNQMHACASPALGRVEVALDAGLLASLLRQTMRSDVCD